MKPPIFVQPLSLEEREALEAGLRSPSAWVLRRCQCLLQSAQGFTPRQIQRRLGVSDETVRRAIRAYQREGLSSLSPKKAGPKTIRRALESPKLEALKELLHQNPRNFGLSTSLWTLEGAAKVCFERGLTSHLVSDETVRRAMKRMKVSWKRAKRWMNSPDPAYARKKGHETG